MMASGMSSSKLPMMTNGQMISCPFPEPINRIKLKNAASKRANLYDSHVWRTLMVSGWNTSRLFSPLEWFLVSGGLPAEGDDGLKGIGIYKRLWLMAYG